MTHLLDTNILIALFKGDEDVRCRLTRLSLPDVAVPSLVLAELSYGAHKSARVEQNLRRIGALRFPVLAFDAEDARCAGEIRAVLSAAGTPIGPYDTLIAGQARARGLTLVTRNRKEFDRVPGLLVEDWLAAAGPR